MLGPELILVLYRYCVFDLCRQQQVQWVDILRTKMGVSMMLMM